MGAANDRLGQVWKSFYADDVSIFVIVGSHTWENPRTDPPKLVFYWEGVTIFDMDERYVGRKYSYEAEHLDQGSDSYDNLYERVC